MTETFEQKTERNIRAHARYDELMREGRHGHYETMSHVIREEVELALMESKMTSARQQAINLKRAFAEHDICWPHGRGVTLFWDQTGPLIRYADSTLYIEDLNPEVAMKWRISRNEMFKLGWRCLIASMRR